MKNTLWSVIVALSAFPAGLAATDAIAQNNSMTVVPLTATTRNAGHTAQATLAAQGDQTAITLLVGGVPDEVNAPPHLYAFIYRGTCASHDTKPTYDLNRTVLPDNLPGNGGVLTLSRRAPAILSELRGGGYTVVVRTSRLLKYSSRKSQSFPKEALMGSLFSQSGSWASLHRRFRRFGAHCRPH